MNRSLYSRRHIAVWGGLLMLILLPAFCWLGFWQWDKAAAKFARQSELDARSQGQLLEMPLQAADAEALRYHRFILHGEYDAAHQVLIDNRVHAERAGYHVVTPLKLKGSDVSVLVNRGWVPAAAEHRVLPQVPPPAGPVVVTGVAVVPPSRFFTLGETPTGGAEAVWQHLDLERFRSSVGYPLQPVVVQLDETSATGYVRDWPRPDEHADRNLGYAVQWFGFAAASLGIWLYFLFRRQP
jgi:surfeit locus 1 family protein